MARWGKDDPNPFLESTYAGKDPVLTGQRDPAKEKPPVSLTNLMNEGRQETRKITETWICEDPKSVSNDHAFQVVVELGPRDFSPHYQACPDHPKNTTRRLLPD